MRSIAVLFDDVRDIQPYIRAENAFVRLSKHWPGPLTLVVEARRAAWGQILVAEDGTIGVRQPDDGLARRFAAARATGHLRQQLEPLGVRVTRLARGLPMGGDLEYADQNTLLRALSGRQEID